MFLLVTTLIKFFVFAFGFGLALATVLTWMERRQSAYSQDRLGPTRAHFLKFGGRPFTIFGLLHPIADTLKTFFKESFAPQAADGFLHRLAPLVGFATAIIAMSLIPFAPDWQSPWGLIEMQIVRVDSGVLLLFAVGSLGIYGTAVAGWASNNRFALLGGMRATAQSISYEIALGLTIVGMLIVAGATEFSVIVGAQDDWLFGVLPAWGIFLQPLGAVLFLAAAIAETKRAPFDMPECESEIIGFFVEYSSMAFGLFMLGEFLEIVVLAAVFTTVFLGGWHLPYLLEPGWLFGFIPLSPLGYTIAGACVFAVKTFLVCAFQLQLRWTVPRFRYDQVMRLGWKSLLPLALINIFVTGVLVWIDPGLGALGGVGLILIAIFVLVVIAGPRRRFVEQASH